MIVQDTFEVAAPASEVYAALLDLERVAPCLPGAEGIEQTGDGSYAGTIRIRVGPMTMRYRADIEILEQDASQLRALIRIRARETRGQGTADAEATLVLAEAAGTTRGSIDVNVSLSGRVASMGQGAIQDVSNRLVGAFAANLGAMLAPPSRPGGDAPASVQEGARPAADGVLEREPSAPAQQAISGLELARAVVFGRLWRGRGSLAWLAAGVAVGLWAGRRI